MIEPLPLFRTATPSKPITTTTNASTPPTPLPPLPYTPSNHKRSIAITWTIIVANSCLLPIALVYGLCDGTSLSKNTVFGIVTGVFGALGLVQFWWRMWKLLKKDGEFRPLGSRRGWLDFYQINTLLSIVIVATLLAIGTARSPVSLALLSSPPSVLLVVISLQFFLPLLPRTAFRISSLPRGATTRPGVYTMLEDVMAVDVGLGREYRQALEERWTASERFRRMLWKVGWFWAGGGLVVGAIVLGVVVWMGERETMGAFAVGWASPWVWAGIWAAGTWWFVRRELEGEAREWRVEGSGEQVVQFG